MRCSVRGGRRGAAAVAANRRTVRQRRAGTARGGDSARAPRARSRAGCSAQGGRARAPPRRSRLCQALPRTRARAAARSAARTTRPRRGRARLQSVSVQPERSAHSPRQKTPKTHPLAPPAPPPGGGAPPPLRVLVLHGRGQSAALFHGRLAPLRRRCGALADFVFLDAPHALPPAAAGDANAPASAAAAASASSSALREWWPHLSGAGDGDFACDSDAAHASAAAGWPEARAAIAAAWAERGPFDALLGFSQGAAAAYLCARDAAEHDDAKTSTPFPGLRCAVFVSGYAPRTAAPSGAQPHALLRLPSLHVFSAAGDASVAPAASRLLASRFASPARHEHAAGHCLPQRAPDLEALHAFLAQAATPPPQRAPAPAPLPQQLPPPPRGAPGFAAPATARAAVDVAPAPYDVPEAQQEELTALGAIFGAEFELVREAPPLCRIAVAWRDAPENGTAGAGAGTDGATPWLFACFALTAGYPEHEAPRCSLAASTRGALRAAHAAAGEAAMADAVRDCGAGVPSLFAAATAAREWAEAHAAALAARGDGDAGGSDSDDGNDANDANDAAAAAAARWWDDDETVIDAAAMMAADAAASAAEAADGGAGGAAGAVGGGAAARQRAWVFTVGLVGKPSAGKSTFFNAATRPEDARHVAAMAAHPFTTIAPNVGAAFYAAPCPCAAMGLTARCAPVHGKPGIPRTRRQPIIVKDVAGLVPGAYAGRGRGNAFLNDIVDADALIHVVDASGTTDSEGASGAGDPLGDVAWVRRELHAWVFSNVRAKWGALRKKAMPRHVGADPDAPLARLCDLFSGYRAPRAAVLLALRRAGLDACRLSCGRDGIPGWSAADVHRLVASFLRVRFPVVLALNKADLPDAAAHVAALRAALPGETAVACAASAEWWLATAVAAGHVTYNEGACDATCTPAADDATRAKLAALRKRVFAPWGGTGVLAALSAAVALRAPLLLLPVSVADVADEAADVAGGTPAAPAPALRHCVLLRPCATLDDAFAALRREGLTEGELVRAERIALDAGRKASALRKEEGQLRPGEGGVIVLRLATNKRTAWQKRGGGGGGGGGTGGE
jgi:ribosome-binding ATPase YchF (GTP1/OBG family)